MNIPNVYITHWCISVKHEFNHITQRDDMAKSN